MAEIWLNRKICVTGGSGFLGRSVVARLASCGAAAPIVPRSAECDLRVRERVFELFEQSRPQVVVHLAARVGGIGANRAHPGTFFHDNLVMGINIVEAARATGVEKLVMAGTICSYPKHTPVPFRESNLWNGYPEETNAPYGIAKKSLLVMLQAYRHEFGLRGIYLMPVNLYGPHDNFDPETSHVIPALIRRCVEARRANRPEITCWGSGNVTREFLYVEDCAEAIVAAMERYDGEDPINIGSGREIAIKDLATLVADISGYRGEIRWDPAKPDGQPRRCLDTSRAAAELGWRARTSLEDGLRRTVAWYEREISGETGAV